MGAKNKKARQKNTVRMTENFQQNIQ